MKFLLLLLGAVIASTNAAANTSVISFDGLSNTRAFIQGGFRFEGVLSPDNNFTSSPALRIYGNVPLTISSVDGGTFSLDRFNLLYQYDASAPWWISNERGQGFQLSRTGELVSGQIAVSSMQDVSRLTIFDPFFRGTNYYIFDNFKFFYAAPAAPIPEPTTVLLFFSGFGLLSAFLHRKTAIKAPRISLQGTLRDKAAHRPCA